ncbi:MAG: hypothetical protein QM796_08470, partial [Chthoniobacteraceae bacterium]
CKRFNQGILSHLKGPRETERGPQLNRNREKNKKRQIFNRGFREWARMGWPLIRAHPRNPRLNSASHAFRDRLGGERRSDRAGIFFVCGEWEDASLRGWNIANPPLLLLKLKNTFREG